jgi:apoptosis-inducing factor 2
MAAERKKQLVIMGSSYAGVSTAHYLLKHVVPSLPEPDTYQVTMISPASQSFCRPACPRAMISDSMFPQHKLFIDTAKQFEQYPAGRFRFVHGKALQLEYERKIVKVELSEGGQEEIAFRAAVIATGASSSSPLLGLQEGEDITTLKHSWNEFRQALPDAKHIVIVGGGPAGIETAGELGEYLNGKPGWFASKPKDPKVQITVLTAASKILPILRRAIAKTALEDLAAVGVVVRMNTRVVSISPPNAGSASNIADPAELRLEDGSTIKADIYIPATGLHPNTSFLEPSLLSADKRVKTNPMTLRVAAGNTSAEGLYAVGDVASTDRPAVHLILNAIPVLCNNIKQDLQLAAGVSASAPELTAERTYKSDKTETQLVPIGKARGVGALMGWRLPSLLVWAIKGRDYWLWTMGDLWSGKQWNKAS